MTTLMYNKRKSSLRWSRISTFLQGANRYCSKALCVDVVYITTSQFMREPKQTMGKKTTCNCKQTENLKTVLLFIQCSEWLEVKVCSYPSSFILIKIRYWSTINCEFISSSQHLDFLVMWKSRVWGMFKLVIETVTVEGKTEVCVWWMCSMRSLRKLWRTQTGDN